MLFEKALVHKGNEGVCSYYATVLLHSLLIQECFLQKQQQTVLHVQSNYKLLLLRKYVAYLFQENCCGTSHKHTVHEDEIKKSWLMIFNLFFPL